MPFTEPFQPHRLLRGAYLQTLLASHRLRTLGGNQMKSVAQKRILTTTSGVRLLAAVSSVRNKKPKAGVILLHGWEGSMDSTYVLQTGKHLYQCGYNVYRINLRDHGESHHLNEGLFFATLLDETFEAVSHAASEMEGLPIFVVGFSLGGNFALRIARHLNQHPINALKEVVAISPVLDPDKATDCIDGNIFLQFYFLRKWMRSLRLKQSLYPNLYNFSPIMNMGNVRAVTDQLIPRYTHFKSAVEYFQGYTLKESDLLNITIPTTIITSKDDPVIPVDDFYKLKLNSKTKLVIHDHGGHNGFIESILLSSWYERKLSKHFDRIVAR